MQAVLKSALAISLLAGALFVSLTGCPHGVVNGFSSAVLGLVSLAVTETSPTADAVDVPSTAPITVRLNKPIDPESVLNSTTNSPTGTIVLKDENAADVAATVTYNADTFTITLVPVTSLAQGRRYTVVVRDLRDMEGNTLADPVSWTFSTIPAAEDSHLQVVSTDPPPATTQFARNGAILIRFDRQLDSASVVNPMTNSSTGAFLLKTPAGANVAGTITYNPSTSTLAFVPSTFLSANLTYTASVKDVRTLDGHALAEPYIWTFTTGLAPSALPTILSTEPVDEATAVSRATQIQAVFSEPITGISNSTFVVRDMITNTVLTPRSLVFDPVTLIVTFRPQVNLSPNTVYTVTVQDVSGLNGLLLPQYTWSFTTSEQPDTSPTIATTVPPAGAIGVARNARIQAVFDGGVTGVSGTTFLLRNSLTNTLVTAENVSFLARTRTATLIPSAFLAANTRYTATLRGINSVDGVAVTEYSWEFTTGATPDNIAPTLPVAGLVARPNCATEVTLSWSPGSDDVTGQAAISYQVFWSRTTSGYDLNVPSAITAAGATSYRVTGLTPGAAYFFNVRAVDESLNRSASVTERTATTPTVFGCATQFAVAGGPTALASADFNADGDADLAVACQNLNQIAVFLGNGSGGFSPGSPATISTAGQPIDLKCTDLNNDGITDLVAASRTAGQISVMIGNGLGGFGAPIVTAVPGARSIAIGEFNNPSNGNRDLAIATGDDITILSGNGNGTFSGTTTRLTLAGVADAHAVTTGDFDGDGLTDVGVSYASTDQAAAWLNATPAAGALTFTAPTTGTNRLFTVQNAPSAISAADIDSDGRPDLAILNSSTPSLTVRPSSAQAANLFPGGENTALTVGTFPLRIASGDLDGDGLPDFVVTNRATNTVTALLNLMGTSLFTVETTDVGLTPMDAALADFDGDGLLDAAVANQTDNTVSVLINGR